MEIVGGEGALSASLRICARHVSALHFLSLPPNLIRNLSLILNLSLSLILNLSLSLILNLSLSLILSLSLATLACRDTAKRPAAKRPAETAPAPKPAVIPAPDAPRRPSSAAARYRTGRPEANAANVPDDIRRGLQSDPESFVAPLVAHLVRGQPDDLGRIKAIHDWIALNTRYDVDGYFGTAPRAGTTWADTLKGGKSVCEGYASVFERLCAAADLKCVKVGGYGRGYGYRVFDEDERTASGNHAWTAAKAGDRWYLLDATWDSGHLDGRAFVPRYSTDYLFLEPADFAYTHLPEDARWQLLDPPLSLAEFKRMPFLRGRFFASGLALMTPADRVNDVDATERLELSVPPDLRILASLTDDAGRELPDRTLVQPSGANTEVLVRFPSAGRYKLDLFLMRAGETRGEGIATIGYRARRGTTERFPKTYATFHDLSCRIESPRTLPLPATGPTRFRLTVPGAARVQLLTADREWIPLRPVEGAADAWETLVSLPDGPVQVMMNDGKDERRYQAVLEYGR